MAAAAAVTGTPSIADPALALQWQDPNARCSFLTRAIAGFSFPKGTLLQPGLVPEKHSGTHNLMARCRFAVLRGPHLCGASIYIAMTSAPQGDILPRPGMHDISGSFCVECLLLQHRTLKIRTAIDPPTPIQLVELKSLVQGFKDNGIGATELTDIHNFRDRTQNTKTQLYLRGRPGSTEALPARETRILQLMGLHSDDQDRTISFSSAMATASLIAAVHSFSTLHQQYRGTHTTHVSAAKAAHAAAGNAGNALSPLVASLKYIVTNGHLSQPHNLAHNDERALVLRAYAQLVLNLRAAASDAQRIVARDNFAAELPIVYKYPILIAATADGPDPHGFAGGMALHTINMDGMLNVHSTLAHFILTIVFTRCYICMPVSQIRAWIEDTNAVIAADSRSENVLFRDDMLIPPTLIQLMTPATYARVYGAAPIGGAPPVPPALIVPAAPAVANPWATAAPALPTGAVPPAADPSGPRTYTQDDVDEAARMAAARAVAEFQRQTHAPPNHQVAGAQAPPHQFGQTITTPPYQFGQERPSAPTFTFGQARPHAPAFGLQTAPQAGRGPPAPGFGHYQGYAAAAHGTPHAPHLLPRPPPAPAAGLGGFGHGHFAQQAHGGGHGAAGYNPGVTVPLYPTGRYPVLPPKSTQDLLKDPLTVRFSTSGGEFHEVTPLTYKQSLSHTAKLLEGLVEVVSSSNVNYFNISQHADFKKEMQNGTLINEQDQDVSSAGSIMTAQMNQSGVMSGFKFKESKLQFPQIRSPNRLKQVKDQIDLALVTGMQRQAYFMTKCASVHDHNYGMHWHKREHFRSLREPFKKFFKAIEDKLGLFMDLNPAASVIQLNNLWMYVNWTFRFYIKKKMFLSSWLHPLWVAVLRYQKPPPCKTRYKDDDGAAWNNSMNSYFAPGSVRSPALSPAAYGGAPTYHHVPAQPAGRGRGGQQRNPRKVNTKRDKIPQMYMRGAPPSVYAKYKNVCVKCHSPSHVQESCPIIPATATPAQKAKLAAAEKLNAVIRGPRSTFLKAARLKWQAAIDAAPA
mgnify:FL=1